jgi:hypothetical protein
MGEHVSTAVHIAIYYDNLNMDILLLSSEGKFVPALSLMIQARDLQWVLYNRIKQSSGFH